MLVISRFRYDDNAVRQGLTAEYSDVTQGGAAGKDGLAQGGAAGKDGLAQRATTELATCLTALAEQPGFVDGAVGRALDDPTLWVLHTRWENVGSYRRALSSYEIKMTVVPLLSYAVDEPSAYEIVVGEGATVPNEARPRGW